jgi:hypothetical protein
VAADAPISTVLADGTIDLVPPDQVVPGENLHGRLLLDAGALSLVHGTLAYPFFWHGVVTGVTTDESGAPLSIQLDGLVTITVSQAAVVGVPPGREAAEPEDDALTATADEGETELIQVGATLGVAGIAKNGIFAAVVINVAAVDFISSGTIQSLDTDAEGHVVGFTMDKNGTSTAVVLTPFTRLFKGKRPVPPSALAVGTKVLVKGKVRADGSVLAYEVKIQR